jgi:hypothetical protein
VWEGERARGGRKRSKRRIKVGGREGEREKWRR